LPISAEKLRGLRLGLSEHGIVHFKNGAAVSVVACDHCDGIGSTPLPDHPMIKEDRRKCGWCAGEGRRIFVTRGYGGGGHFTFGELELAYDRALNGWPRKRQPSGDGSKYGDDPPF
jgi:hypothetical protein